MKPGLAPMIFLTALACATASAAWPGPWHRNRRDKHRSLTRPLNPPATTAVDKPPPSKPVPYLKATPEVARPSAMPSPRAPQVPSPGEVARQLEAQRRVFDGLRNAIEAYSKPNELTDWPVVLCHPDYPQRLARAFYCGLQAKPQAAYRALLDGAVAGGESDPLFAHRIALIILTLRPKDTPPGDAIDADVAALAATLAGEHADTFAGQLEVPRPLLAREVLARARDNRLPADLAVRFGRLDPARPIVSLCVFGLARGVAGAEDYWRRSDLVATQNTDPADLSLLAAADDSRPDELEEVFRTLPSLDPAHSAEIRKRLEAAFRHELDRLRRLPRARRLDDSALFVLAGLRGDPDSLASDLARLTHGPSRAAIERALERPAARSNRNPFRR